MDKAKILEKYKKEEEHLLISKLFDKITLTEKQNKIQTTDFLSPVEMNLLIDILNLVAHKNYVTYGGRKYQYNIVNIYNVDKTGTVTIERNFDITTLTLITCTYNDDTKQTVYIAELVG